MPRFNPELTSLFSGWGNKLQTTSSSITEKVGGTYTFIMIVLGIAILIGLFVWYGKYRSYYETPSNIQRIIKERTQAASGYDMARDKRIDLPKYLSELKKAGVPDTHFSLTNFYISTANACGIFLPGEDGVASEYAARAVVAGGARAFVFDIWPDLTPGGDYAPILQIVESGSLWRRISLNSVPFVKVIKTIIHEIFESSLPGYNDVAVFYLRFRGNPKPQTFDGVLRALQACVEPYRLDASFNNCRGQKGDTNRLFSTPISELFKKVIIVSNNVARGHGLNDYINIGPDDGVKVEWGVNEAAGLNDQAKQKAINDIQQNLAFVAPFSEDKKAETNNWNQEESMKLGIQYIAMNFLQSPPSESLTTYLSTAKFGRSSYLLKPEPLRYIPMYLTNPKSPEDPKWGSGPTAGTPTIPPPIQLPTS